MSNMDWMRGNFKKTPGYVCPPGKKNFPEMSFHNTPVVKGYADGQSVSDNGFFASLLRRTSTKDTDQDAAPIEDRVKEREEKAVKTQNITNDLLNTLSRGKSDEKVNTAPAVSTSSVSSEYRASTDSQDASADPSGKYTVDQYKANKEKIDKNNQAKANNDKRSKALDEERAKREKDERETLAATKQDFSSAPTANIAQTTVAAAPITSAPAIAAPVIRPYVPPSAASASAPTASKSVKTESAPKVKLVGGRFEYPADKVIDPYNEGFSGDGVKGYPLRDDDPRWKSPIPKN